MNSCHVSALVPLTVSPYMRIIFLSPVISQDAFLLLAAPPSGQMIEMCWCFLKMESRVHVPSLVLINQVWRVMTSLPISQLHRHFQSTGMDEHFCHVCLFYTSSGRGTEYQVWCRCIQALLKYELTSSADFNWLWWTKIKNPSDNFCEAWSEHHLCQIWWRLDKISDLWIYFWTSKSNMVEIAINWCVEVGP